MIKFVTSNAHKYREAETLFKKRGIEISWEKMKYEEIQADDNETICRILHYNLLIILHL